MRTKESAKLRKSKPHVSNRPQPCMMRVKHEHEDEKFDDAMETPPKTRSQPETLEAPDAPMKRARTTSGDFAKIRYIRRYISIDKGLSCEHHDSSFYVRVIPDQDFNPPAYRCDLDHIIQTGEMASTLYSEIERRGYKDVTSLVDGDSVCIWFIVIL